MDLHDLTRLASIDAALASPEGLHYATAADHHGCTTKTIQRLVSLLRSTGREIALHESATTGKPSIHRYAPGVGRLFLPPGMVAVPRGGRPETHDDAKRQQVATLAGLGVRYADIVTQTGVAIATVKRWAKDSGIKRARGPKPKSA